MTIENTDVLIFTYREHTVTIWYCHHCCGEQPKSKKLWVWRINSGNEVLYKQEEMDRHDAEVNSMKWVDAKMDIGTIVSQSIEVPKIVIQGGPTPPAPVQSKISERPEVKTVKYKGHTITLIYCKQCGDRSGDNKIWKWHVAGGGADETADGATEAAKKWIDGL